MNKHSLDEEYGVVYIKSIEDLYTLQIVKTGKTIPECWAKIYEERYPKRPLIHPKEIQEYYENTPLNVTVLDENHIISKGYILLKEIDENKKIIINNEEYYEVKLKCIYVKKDKYEFYPKDSFIYQEILNRKKGEL